MRSSACIRHNPDDILNSNQVVGTRGGFQVVSTKVWKGGTRWRSASIITTTRLVSFMRLTMTEHNPFRNECCPSAIPSMIRAKTSKKEEKEAENRQERKRNSKRKSFHYGKIDYQSCTVLTDRPSTTQQATRVGGKRRWTRPSIIRYGMWGLLSIKLKRNPGFWNPQSNAIIPTLANNSHLVVVSQFSQRGLVHDCQYPGVGGL